MLLRKTQQILNALGFNDHELSLVIMDDPEILELNQKYRGISASTNVLSFSMQEGEFGDITPKLLGDVIISLDTAEREADAAKITLEERITQLLIHGILHLIGYDHEKGDEAARVMEEKSLQLVRLIEENQKLPPF